MTDRQWYDMGQRIRMARKIRRITAKEVCRLTGYSKTHLQDLENGKSGATLELLVMLAKIFDLSLDYIILGISPIPSKSTILPHLKCGPAAQEPGDEHPADGQTDIKKADNEALKGFTFIPDTNAEIVGDTGWEAVEETWEEWVRRPINWLCVGRRIREMRIHCGAAISELAEFVHISRSHMSNIEHGTRAASVDVIVEIVLAVGATIDYIVRGIRPVIGAGTWR